MTAPPFISSTQVASNATSPKTTTSIAVQSGDLLVAYGYVENSANAVAVTTASGNTSAWTLREDVVVPSSSSDPYLIAFTATATATGNITVTFTRTGTNIFTGVVKVWRGSAGIGNVNRNSNGNVTPSSPTISVTTTGANSGLDFANCDWNGVTGTVTFTASSGTPVSDVSDQTNPANYCLYSAHVADAGAAGSKTFGMSAPTGQRYICDVIEILGSSAAALVPTLTAHKGLGFPVGPYNFMPKIQPGTLVVPVVTVQARSGLQAIDSGFVRLEQAGSGLHPIDDGFIA